jgi:hypothetical protein
VILFNDVVQDVDVAGVGTRPGGVISLLTFPAASVTQRGWLEVLGDLEGDPDAKSYSKRELPEEMVIMIPSPGLEFELGIAIGFASVIKGVVPK